jgi:hypothetical protein
VDGFVLSPAPVTTFHQRRAVKRPQAREQGQRQERALAETERPAVLHGLKYRGWTFNDGYFVFHRNLVGPESYHKAKFYSNRREHTDSSEYAARYL